MIRDTGFVSVSASIGFAVLLFISTGFAFFTSAATTAAMNRSRSVETLRILYASARFAVVTEESLERKYRLEPGPGVARDHAAAAKELTKALEALAVVAPPANAAEARRLLTLHGRYLSATHRMFAAVDAHDEVRVVALDHGSADPIFSTIQARVFARAAEERRAAAVAFDALEITQRNLRRAAVALRLLGLTCLLSFLFANYGRSRLARRRETKLHRMEEAVLVDSVTNIGNHRAFKEELQREMSLAVRHSVPLTLALLDIDEFKLVNDQNGHAHGDRVLVELANVLRAGRPEDRAYRIGGDEFAIILPHTSASDSRSVLDRIRVATSKRLYGSTVSVGYSTLNDPNVTAEVLQSQADAALYVTKRSGRNGVSQFDASNKGTWLLSTERVRSLRELLASGMLPIAFQPIWDLDRAEIFAFEALLRPPASFGFAGPQDAFDLAERIGRAHELDRASWLSALSHARGLPAKALLFLNVSPQTLDRNFDVGEFTASVRSFGLRPDRVVIEITEHAIAHIDNVVAVARSLQAAGFGIALDDTGSGHAGLEIMSRLRFDYVKIDREIIVKAMADRNAGGVVAAIVAFARATDAYVIAEGIEDLAMLDFIEHAGRAQATFGRGIRGAQGYLLRRPSQTLPVAAEVLDVTAILSEHAVPLSAA